MASKTINGVNALLKKGAPTDTLSPNVSSIINGQIVPINTTKVETISNRLLEIKELSRLIKENAEVLDSSDDLIE